MTKKLYLPIATLSLILLTTPIYAMNAENAAGSGAPGTPDPMRNAVENAGSNATNSEKVAELKARLEQEREQIAARIRSRIAERCKQIEARVQSRIANFEENKQTHVDKYNSIKEKFGNTIAKLQEKGVDTAKLEEDAQTLDGKVQNFAADYTTFIEKLTETQQYACGESEGAFIGSLKGAREQLQIVRGDVQDIKTFYREVIKQDILDLRSSNNL